MDLPQPRWFPRFRDQLWSSPPRSKYYPEYAVLLLMVLPCWPPPDIVAAVTPGDLQKRAQTLVQFGRVPDPSHRVGSTQELNALHLSPNCNEFQFQRI